MSKAVKTVVSVVAAVAIPFAAPAIASSIGLSAAIGGAVGSATAGAVLGGAVTGAALGAAKGAILGEDVGRSALFGGIGGGIGGYTSAASAATAPAGGAAGGTGITAPAASAGASPYALGGGGGTGLTLGGGGTGLAVPGATTAGGLSTGGVGLSGAMAPVDYSLAAGAQFPTMGLNPATAGIGLRAPDPGFFASSVDRALAAGTPIDYSLAAGMPPSQGLSVVSAAPGGGTQVVTGQGVYTSTTPIGAYSGGTYSPTLAASTGMGAAPAAAPTAQQPTAAPTTAATAPTGATSQPTTFSEALSKAGDELKAKFTDPKALADLTLRAAGQLAGSALAGTGLSAEEQALLNAQTEELRMLQQTNQALFNQRLEQAQNLIGESKYFDPEYFGLQRARRAQIAGARAKRAGLRGLTGGAREAEARRFDLATGRDVGTAYDVGYGTGVSGRLQTMQAGLSQMPTSFPSSMSEYSNLRQAYAGAEQRRAQQAKDIGSLFGSLTGRSG